MWPHIRHKSLHAKAIQGYSFYIGDIWRQTVPQKKRLLTTVKKGFAALHSSFWRSWSQWSLQLQLCPSETCSRKRSSSLLFFVWQLAAAVIFKPFTMATHDERQNRDAQREPTRLTAPISHARLASTDAESIRVFLHLHDSYSTEIKERAKQLLGEEICSSEFVSPTSLKLCVNGEQLKSFFNCGSRHDERSSVS